MGRALLLDHVEFTLHIDLHIVRVRTDIGREGQNIWKRPVEPASVRRQRNG